MWRFTVHSGVARAVLAGSWDRSVQIAVPCCGTFAGASSLWLHSTSLLSHAVPSLSLHRDMLSGVPHLP
jgi:hypothetical protein